MISVDPVPFRDGHVLSLSLVLFVKEENHRIECRHWSYKPIVQAGLIDWWFMVLTRPVSV